MIFTYRLLFDAWNSASKDKSKDNQAKFKYFLEENLYTIQSKLESHTFEPSPLRTKKIYIPKARIAQVPTLIDKIVQHAICDNYAYEALTKPLIPTTFACIKGRGDKYARITTKAMFRKFWNKEHVKPYVLKCDIHNYFASIPHERLILLIDKYILDNDVNELMKKFLKLMDVGIPLGLQQSQLLANIYLSELDHKIKEEKKIKFYGRYMDDFFILSKNREELEELQRWITDYIESIGLEMNPKTGIFYNELNFLGFKFFITDSGKTLIRMINKKKISERHRLKLQVRQLNEKTITPQQLSDSYVGWRSHAQKGNTYKMVNTMDDYLKSMLGKIGYEALFAKRRVIIYDKNNFSIDSRSNSLSG